LRFAALPLFCFALAAPAPALAQTYGCGSTGSGSYGTGGSDIVRCLTDQVERLTKENRELKHELQTAQASLPVEYLNVDGKANVAPDRPVSRAGFTLNARRTGRASSLALDMAVLTKLCAKSDGCTISLTYRSFGLLSDSPRDTAGSGDCRFSYDASGVWKRAAGCGDQEAASGVDGNRQLSADEASAGIITQVAGACLFSDGDIDIRSAASTVPVLRDRARGLFLIAVPGGQANPARRFQCELAVQ